MSFNPVAFAKSTIPKGGSGCKTCATEAAKDIRACLEVWAVQHGTYPNLTGLWRELREHRGFPFTRQAVINHVHRCEPKLWAQIQKRLSEPAPPPEPLEFDDETEGI